MIGRTLSHYKIVAELGRGGMGIVYRAEDQTLKRQIALKILPGDALANQTRKQRFLREARAAAALKHPSIAVIYGIDEDQGVTFITMELVEGRKLSELMETRGLTPSDSLAIAIQICQGLGHAHDRGVVHRDLKPANVMVTDSGQVKLIDFGLAKLLDPAVPHPADLTPPGTLETHSGIVMGTFAYMSPEQARGHRVNHRADAFSFGVVLFEMLTGEAPFRRATGPDSLAALLHEPAPRLTSSRFASLGGLAPDLDRIVQRCLAKNPEDRYDSMKDALGELMAVSRSSSDSEATLRPFVPPVPSTYKPPPTSIAVLPFTDMSESKDKEYLCEGMAEEIINVLSRIAELRVAARTSAFQFKGGASDIRRVGRALNVAAVLEGSVRTAGKRLRVTVQLVEVATGYHLWARRFDSEADDVFDLEDKIAAEVVSALEVKLGSKSHPRIKRYTRDVDAYHDYLKGRYYWFKRHRGAAQAAIEWYARAIARDPDHAPAHAGLAKSYAMLGVYGFLPPAVAAEKTKAAAERAALLDPDLAESHEALWSLRFWCEWDWGGAEQEILKAIALDPTQSSARSWHALLSGFLGKIEPGLEQARSAAAMDPLSAYALVVLGMLLLSSNRADEAIAELERALVFEPEFSLALFTLGSAYSVVGRSEEAISTMERAAEASSRAAFFLGWLGWAYGAAGKYQEARAVLEELQHRSESQYVPPLAFAWITSKLPDPGERESTLGYVEKSFAERSPMLTFWPLPVCDALRADERFANLRARMDAG